MKPPSSRLLLAACLLASIAPHTGAASPSYSIFNTQSLRQRLQHSIPQEDIIWLREATLKQLQGCRVQATNGTWLHTPDGVGNYRALWTRDFQYMVEQAGDLLNTNDILHSIHYLLKGQRADGCMPDRVNTAGKGVYSPGGESSPLADHALDNGSFMAKLLVEATRITGDLTLFRELEPAIRKGLDHTSRAPNGLVFNDSDHPQCPYGFTDTVKKTGHLLFSSLLYYDACRGMEQFCTKAQCGEPETYRYRAQLIRLNLDQLWDDRHGMFFAADEDCRKIDIWGSALAAHLAIATPSQTDRIATYLVQHYEELTQHGQIRHLPAGENWQSLLANVKPGTYQNGAYWATPIAWTAPVIARKDPELAVRMIRQVIADFQNRGIMECINDDYHNVPDYVVSATSVYSLLR